MSYATKAQQRRALDRIISEIERTLETLKAVRAEMHNRSPVDRVARVSKPLTDEHRATIRTLKEKNPGMAQHQIAALLGVDSGRVSEVLAGIRK